MTNHNAIETLMMLLRTAITGVTEEATLPDIDWMAVLEAATDQGVKGLAWQGAELLLKAGKAQMSLDDKLEWFGHVRNTETEAHRLYNVATEFAARLQPCRCVVLKGFDYARYWPNPWHREYGDLDCWCAGAFDESNAKAREIGASVEDGGYKHTHITYNDLAVENHCYFTDFNGTQQGRETERLLSSLMTSQPPTSWRDTALLLPSPMFTALFMLRHAQLHFIEEGIALKHVLDWLFFLQHERDNLDGSFLRRAMETMRMTTFADLMTAFAEQLAGETLSKNTVDASLLEAFIADVTGPQPDIYDMRLHKKALRIARRFGRMWKFRSVLNEPYLTKVWQSLVYNTVTGIEPVAR
ncbi:MAG: nucleotidyltransferase family protein [Bacteroidaceae bacterium]|nr:nucleotidyltransferase family protein [Bacteroidaceae bacterium]